MDFSVFLVFGGLALIVLAAYFIASVVYRRMLKSGKQAAVAVSILTFLASAFVIGVAVMYLVFSNVRLER
jgi:hypothetical protein